MGTDNWDRINPPHPAYDHRIKEMADEIELLRVTNEELRARLQGLQERQAAWGETVTAIQKEVVDVTTRSVQDREEAWDLIDRCMPHLLPFHAFKELHADIEEARKRHGRLH